MRRKALLTVLLLSKSSLIASLIAGMLVSGAVAQHTAPVAYSPQLLLELKQIQQAALRSDYAFKQLAVLTNKIGPRLSGSVQARSAVDYVASELQRLGLDVRLEKILVPHWIRGGEKAELVKFPGQMSGTPQRIILTALGGSVATPPNGLTAEVVSVDSFEELEALGRASVEGKIVLFNRAFDQQMAAQGFGREAYRQIVPHRTGGSSAAARLGAAAVLVRSAGGSNYRLPHAGFTRYAKDVPQIPAAALTAEDSDLIEGLSKEGPVRLHLTLTPQTDPDAVSYNVVADLKGSEQPEQIVIVSGHLDSWDLGTGAIDDGAGVVMAMQTVQVLRELNLHPKRTIRAIAWMGEEYGGIGGKTYAKDHVTEIANHFAAIESDHGAGHPLGFSVKARQAVRPLVDPVSRVLDSSGAGLIAFTEDIETDISPLADAGVPCFGLWQDDRTYFTTTTPLPIHWTRSLQKMSQRTLRLWRHLRMRSQTYHNRFRTDEEGKAMETHQREFLRKISGAAAVAASASVLNTDVGAALSDMSPTLGTESDQSLRNLRTQFPLLSEQVNGHPLVYLDSAATTQRPRSVLDALADFYTHENANPAKSLHTLARRSATLYEKARGTVARFLNARELEEVVWTRGTTEAINLVASSWGSANLGPGDEILVTISDHYSSLVPWQLAARRANATLRILDVGDDGRLRLDLLDTVLSKRTKIVTFPHVSNVLGVINPTKEICERAHRAGALALVDAAQSVPHFSVDVQDLGCDFLAFSGHKMCGPMGIGVLWARRELLDAMPPFQAGSNMAHDVEIESVPAHFAEGGQKFEAGTPNVPGAVGLAAAITFLESLDRNALWTREQELTRYVVSRLSEVKGLRVLGATEPKGRISVFSFVVEKRQALDVVKALDTASIAVRGGDLASLPLLKRMGVTAAVRASCYAYTSTEEVDRLIAELQAKA
jgi:SufS family cysteine desulfurase